MYETIWHFNIEIEKTKLSVKDKNIQKLDRINLLSFKNEECKIKWIENGRDDIYSAFSYVADVVECATQTWCYWYWNAINICSSSFNRNVIVNHNKSIQKPYLAAEK